MNENMLHKPDEAFGDQRLAFGEWGVEKPAVLIVDDEPQLVTAMTDALDEQYRVIGETSPLRALEILKQDPGIHTIISDQRMPVMTGDEFLLRAQEISSATRILVTAYADLGAVIDAVNQGKIFHYIRKPWDGAELRNIIDTAAEHFALGAALRKERMLLKCIMDCSIDAISVKDTNHRYVRLNHAEAAMLGLDAPENVTGRSHAEFLPADRSAGWTEEEDRLLETVEALRERIEHVIDEAGLERWYATTKVPISPSSAAPIGLVSISRDVTESKSIEQIKDDFISTARHELRTPLTVIMGMVGLIRTGRFGPLTPRIEELLLQSELNCDRLLGLINNMLDLQDIIAGRVDLQMLSLSVHELISESRDINAPLAKANDIDVQISQIRPDLTIVGDRQRLTQAIGNLLSNACRFSPMGSAVRVAVLEDAEHVRISVIDQGPGVPSALADRLFKSFGQLDTSASRSHEGAGLGLRLCRAIAEAHGGHVGFAPAPAAGSDFFLVLPRDCGSRCLQAARSDDFQGSFDPWSCSAASPSAEPPLPPVFPED